MTEASEQKPPRITEIDIALKSESARAKSWLILWALLSVFLVAVSLVLLVFLAVLLVRLTHCPVVITDVPVLISDPKEGQALDMTIDVSGTLQNCLPSGTNLYILVRTNMTKHDSYWPQTKHPPVVDCAGWRVEDVGIGGTDDPPGEYSYRVCAVLTEEILTEGKPIDKLPEGPSHCIEVKRK
jgi:hypothetical protein